MLVVGLTSGIGCGKTTVANILRQMNVKVIDSDKIVKNLYAKDIKLQKKLISVFGKEIFDRKKKNINKSVLREIVFSDRKKLKTKENIKQKKEIKKLKKLNSIVHPKVYAEIKKQLKKLQAEEKTEHKKTIKKLLQKIKVNKHKKIIVIDIPLLLETKKTKLVDFLVVVKAKKEIQISRLMKRDKLSKKAALEMISLQLPLSKKIKAADFVIDNSYGFANTKRQVKNLFRQLNSFA